MRRLAMLSVIGVLVLMRIVAAAPQEHGSSHARGAQVMGFDQARTTHHFSLYKDGGAIEVTANDPADTASTNAIRSHLQHIAVMFADGDFNAPMLVHDSTNVSGTKAMAKLKDRLRYSYGDVPAGGRISIATADRGAMDGVHEFLKFQIKEHKTGDPLDVDCGSWLICHPERSRD